MNFVLELDRATSLARHTIVVLTPAYLTALSSTPAWSAAFVQDPGGTARLLLPVRVRQCQPSGLFSALTPIELVGLAQEEARARLLAGVRQGRGKPDSEPSFPGEIVHTQEAEPNFPAKWPEIWLVPYPANQFFTGREKLLETLHKKLARQKRLPQVTALTQAISGLGGIGKTQTALQYAYTYGQEYRTVLWANASSAENLLNSYVNFAATQRMPGYDAQDQRTALPAVKDWLGRQRDWLLILDNADDLTTIQDYLPSGIHMRGHILLTTRASSLGPLVQTVEVAKMDRRDGVTLLLRRSGMLTTSRSVRKKELRSAAETLVAEMDGLPLAIDQAAGYIEERRCSVQDYLRLYQERRRDVLARKNRGSPYYEETVATTWELSFARIREENPAAAELLRFCAFLAPDTIPEELITEGAQYLGDVLGPVAADPLLLNDAIEVLLRYSLIRRNPETKILAIHRLVQVVLKYDMEEGEQRMWAERVIEAVNQRLLQGGNEIIKNYIPHILICTEMIRHYSLESAITAQMLYRAGSYLQNYARYKEAEILYQSALTIEEKTPEPEHSEIIMTLYKLGQLYQVLGNYENAKKFYKKVFYMAGKILDDRHHQTATILYGLGIVYHQQGLYEEAKSTYEQALARYMDAEEIDYAKVIITLYRLATLDEEQGKYESANWIFDLIAAITERNLSFVIEQETDIEIFMNVIVLYNKNKKSGEQVDIKYEDLIKKFENGFNMDNPLVATILYKFAIHEMHQGEYDKADVLFQRALNIRETILGSDHISIAKILRELARLRLEQHRDEGAEALFFMNKKVDLTTEVH